MNPTVYTQSDTTHRCRGVLTFHSEYMAQQSRTQDFTMRGHEKHHLNSVHKESRPNLN